MSKKSQLRRKYETNQSFRKQMDKAQSNYQILSQRLIYSNMSEHDMRFIKKYEGQNRMNLNIFFINGVQQHVTAINLQKLTLAFIKKIQKPKKQYILVYINNEEYPNAFSDFKTVLQIMPIQYYLNLAVIFLVNPTFLQKAGRYFVFGTIPKFLNQHIQNIDEVDEINEKLLLDNKQLAKYIPHISHNKHHFAQKRTQPISMIGDSHHNHKKVEHPHRKYQIEQYDLNQNGLPELFQILVYYFQSHPQGLEEVGIFRKSASIDEQQQMASKMAKKHYGCLEEITNPHIVANLIKRFLGDLLTPIIPYQMFHQLMDEQNVTVQLLATKMKQLKQQNMTKLLTLMFLLQFLITCVVTKAQLNKMTTQNIAICFAPCLMWAKERSLKDLMYATKSVFVLSLMIKNFEQVFGTRKNQNKLYRESYMRQRNRSLQKLNIGDSSQNMEKNGKQNGEQNILAPLQIQKTQSQVISDDSQDDQCRPSYDMNISNKINHTQPKKQHKPEQQNSPSSNKNQQNPNQIQNKKRRITKKGIFTSKIAQQKCQDQKYLQIPQQMKRTNTK